MNVPVSFVAWCRNESERAAALRVAQEQTLRPLEFFCAGAGLGDMPAHGKAGMIAYSVSSWREALERAQGEYVYFFSSDERFYNPSSLEDMIHEITASGNGQNLPDIAHFSAELSDRAGRFPPRPDALCQPRAPLLEKEALAKKTACEWPNPSLDEGLRGRLIRRPLALRAFSVTEKAGVEPLTALMGICCLAGAATYRGYDVLTFRRETDSSDQCAPVLRVRELYAILPLLPGCLAALGADAAVSEAVQDNLLKFLAILVGRLCRSFASGENNIKGCEDLAALFLRHIDPVTAVDILVWATARNAVRRDAVCDAVWS